MQLAFSYEDANMNVFPPDSIKSFQLLNTIVHHLI